eukprot:scaffold29527_cov74-Phaeocystis_antarctica.AAC.2
MTRSAQPHAKKPVCGCCRMPPSPRTAQNNAAMTLNMLIIMLDRLLSHSTMILASSDGSTLVSSTRKGTHSMSIAMARASVMALKACATYSSRSAASSPYSARKSSDAIHATGRPMACRWVSPMMSDETTDMDEHVIAASATSAPPLSCRCCSSISPVLLLSKRARLLERREEHAQNAQRYAEGLDERIDGRAAHAHVPGALCRGEDLQLLTRTGGGLGGRALARLLRLGLGPCSRPPAQGEYRVSRQGFGLGFGPGLTLGLGLGFRLRLRLGLGLGLGLGLKAQAQVSGLGLSFALARLQAALEFGGFGGGGAAELEPRRHHASWNCW